MQLKAISHIFFRVDQVEYKIIPSVTQVSRNKAGDNLPATVTFSVYKIIGGTQTQITSLNAGVKMCVRNTSTGAWSTNFDFVNGSVSVVSASDRIEAGLFPIDKSTWLMTDLLASITVPIVSDGTDGTDAFQIVTTLDSIPVRCSSSGSPLSLPIPFEVRLYKGGLIYNLLNWYSCTVSYDSSSTVTNTYSSDSKLESDYFTITLTGANASTGSITITIVPYAGAAAIVKKISIHKVLDGPVGATGAIYLPRGEWNATDTYLKTSALIHYVVFQGYCYEPKVASVTGGVTPLADVTAGGTNWKSMGKNDLVATKVLLANFALIAGGVFWNDKLMSQAGLTTAGEVSSVYTNYSEDSNGVENGNFHPNLLINFSTGYIKALNADIKGKITSSSGTIGGFAISGSSLTALSGTDEMLLSAALLRFTNSEHSSYVYLGADVMPSSLGGYITTPMRIQVSRTEAFDTGYGNVGVYFDVSGVNAYDSDVTSGNHALYIANGDICGFRLRTRRLSASTTLSSMDSIILLANTSTITIYLPASPKDGQIYFIRKLNTANFNLSGNGHMINRTYSGATEIHSITDYHLCILIWDKANNVWTMNFATS